MHGTKIRFQSLERLWTTFCNQTWYVVHHHEPECHVIYEEFFVFFFCCVFLRLL